MSPFRFNFSDSGLDGNHSDDQKHQTKLGSSGASESAKELLYKVTNSDQHSDETLILAEGVTIKKVALSAPETSKLLNLEALLGSDLVPGKYEGGFKLWECAIDLAKYLCKLWGIDSSISQQGHNFEEERVLELGCGHGIPGILAARLGMTVHFQDFNEEVLSNVTMPNYSLNVPGIIDSCSCQPQFFAGSWAALTALQRQKGLSESYSLILSTDTIYSLESQQQLLHCICESLQRGGKAYIGAKNYYFGIGGSTDSFKKLIQASGNLSCKTCLTISDGNSNTREIILMEKIK